MIKHGEIQSNDIVRIRKIFGRESILSCFGLAPLMLTWKKEEKLIELKLKTH